MKYRKLGNSGLDVSVVGLGCNNFGMICSLDQTKRVVQKALNLGINLFDTADVYGNRGNSELYLGKALGKARKDVLIATKFAVAMGDGPHMRGGSRRYIMQAVEDSLKRLGTDYIDLYQMHAPDPNTPIDETLRALDDLIYHGKVRYIGCSNFRGWQLVEAKWTSEASQLNTFISAQNRYSILSRDLEIELVPAAEKLGVSILPYFPLESGLLTGKYTHHHKPTKGTRWEVWGKRGPQVTNAFFSDAKFKKVEKLRALCDKYEHSLLDLAFGWLIGQPTVASVIAGATKPKQVEQNVNAGNYSLSFDEIAEVDKITAPQDHLEPYRADPPVRPGAGKL